MVNIVGDHALSHQKYDAQLQSDIATVARNVSTFVRSSESASAVGADAVDTVTAALGPPGAVATLILPADVSWSEGGKVEHPASPAGGGATRSGRPPRTVWSSSGGRSALGGARRRAHRRPGVRRRGARAGRPTSRPRTGAKLLGETFPARLERGAGRPAVERLAYLAEFAAMQLDGLRHLVLVDAGRRCPSSPTRASRATSSPTGAPSTPWPARRRRAGALSALASLVGTDGAPAPRQERASHAAPDRDHSPRRPCARSSACSFPRAPSSPTRGTPPGCGPRERRPARRPMTGSASPAVPSGRGCRSPSARPRPRRDRRVVALEADGSALYTLQSWWTMAREGLDVTTIVLNNHSYAVLNMELDRVGATAGPRARDMLDLGRPDIDFVDLATGLGVPATRAEDAEAFGDQLGRALSTPGPSVVEAVLPSSL